MATPSTPVASDEAVAGQMSALQEVDYVRLFSEDYAESFIENRLTNDVISVRDNSGYSIRSAAARDIGYLEYSVFRDDVLLVASDFPQGLSGQSTQIASGGDWLHVQVRLSGSGTESVGAGQALNTPAGSCAFIRCPEGSRTIRDFNANEGWRAVCLYLRPRSVCKLLDLSPSAFEEQFGWLCDPGQLPAEAVVVPIDMHLRRISDDILQNRVAGVFRRSYLKAKAMEFLVVAYEKLKFAAVKAELQMPICSREYDKLQHLDDIMNRNVERPTSLHSLARSIGTNRTRLSEIFKQANGVGVQTYWRKLRLQQAMALLSAERLPVTEVAARVGYANVSSLSRAFAREFGVVPKDVRPPRQRR